MRREQWRKEVKRKRPAEMRRRTEREKATFYGRPLESKMAKRKAEDSIFTGPPPKGQSAVIRLNREYQLLQGQDKELYMMKPVRGTEIGRAVEEYSRIEGDFIL